MERARRVGSLWSWLPAFRAVAETEHLPTASEALHVSASSLSRTIRLLEDDVGRPLFDRVGRQLVLNEAGREMLRAVRDAMRRVDEALVTLGPGRLVGPVHVSVPGPLAPLYVLPALRALAAAHPELSPHVTSVPAASLGEALAQGRVDVAVIEDPPPTPELTRVILTEVPHALCCGPGHPLFARGRPTADEIAAHPFVAPTPSADGRIPDRWPTHRPRRVGLFVQQMQVGIEACRGGGYLAVLPWPVAERAGLRRLPMRGIASSTLCALHRPTLGPAGRTEAVVRALVASP
jgi:DNA-binding transcriptional LysR family regulator